LARPPVEASLREGLIRRKWNKRFAILGSLFFFSSEKAAIENISLKSVNNFQDAKTSSNVIKDIPKDAKSSHQERNADSKRIVPMTTLGLVKMRIKN
jgi:hypothetical protein